jgi:PAS domain S-box-containing protein
MATQALAVTTASIPVLIVDDDEAYANFVRAALSEARGARFDLQHVTRLSQVLPALDRRPSTVILLDVNLPDGNGLKWLSGHWEQLRGAVLVLTGDTGLSTDPDVIAGAQDFLIKSEVDPEHMIRAVRYAADRELARQELLRSRAYFQSLIEQARDLITVVDERGIIRYQSPGIIHMLGLAAESFVGKSLFSLVDHEQGTRGRELLRGVFGGNNHMPIGEFSLTHLDGSIRHLEVVASRIAPDGGMQRVVLNSRDVTERRRAEEAVKARDEMLMQSKKMEAVGRLAGGIAHDFSNVLTVVTQACERLKDRILAGQASTTEIDMILRNTERAASLTRRLQAFSRQQVLAPRPLHLGKLVNSATELLEQFIGEDIHLSIEIAPDLHPVEADPVQIQQVLMNLAINARDAMPSGGWLRFRAWNATVDPFFAESHPPMLPGNYVLLEVSDTGHGMDADTKAHAFEPFFTTKDPVRAGGLGLATVYGIIKQSGGYIWIDSVPGHGTSFSLYLPPTDTQPVEVEPKKAVKKRTSRKAATILLTEDEDDVRELLDDMLTANGFKVLVAANAGEALTVSGQFHGKIDLLLTDVVMPGGTGRDLARSLTGVRPQMGVLYMSGYPEHGAPPGSVLEPGVPFLSKPFTRDTLLEKIREMLE